MEWYIQHINPITNLTGLLFDIIGAWLVAWEVVQQYKGEKYKLNHIPEEKMRSTMRPSAEDHPDYKLFESHKHRKMKWGLACLTIGFILQMLPNLFQII